MKIIHCADVHLDCKTNLPAEKRIIKRNQLLQNFVDLVDFAKRNDVEAILICGDLFHDKKPLKKTLKTVCDTILNNPQIMFFYVFGNHDENLKLFENPPANYVAFDKTFFKVRFKDVVIGGASFSRHFAEDYYDHFKFDKDDFNILMLHAPLHSDTYNEHFQIKNLHNVDYLALGHIHMIESAKFGRGEWCYSGCLEGKSFKEFGKCGFQLLEIENKKLTRTFVPFSKYDYQIVEIDISKTATLQDVMKLLAEKTQDFGAKDLVKVIFVGSRKEEFELNLVLLEQQFKNNFFYLEFEDKTRVAFDLEKYAKESLSLKAEFINSVYGDESLSDEEKQQICLVGLQALKGEEVLL